jgi:hypothetical protein
MKKITIFIGALIFVLFAVLQTQAATTTRQIKLQAKDPAKSMTSTSSQALVKNASSTLEKILTPADIKFYEKIQKIGSSLWGVRKMSQNRLRLVQAGEATCVQAAIKTKDGAWLAQIDSFQESLKAAINKRSACQQNAISSTEKQSENLEACLKDFQSSQKLLKETEKNSYSAITKTYQQSLKGCSSTSATGTIMLEDGAEID